MNNMKTKVMKKTQDNADGSGVLTVTSHFECSEMAVSINPAGECAVRFYNKQPGTTEILVYPISVDTPIYFEKSGEERNGLGLPLIKVLDALEESMTAYK